MLNEFYLGALIIGYLIELLVFIQVIRALGKLSITLRDLDNTLLDIDEDIHSLSVNIKEKC